MANISDIASYIYGRAPNFNVDPNLALGVARFEGLNPNTIGSPTFGNRDARGYSFGPFQLFSGSQDPNRIAPGGMAYEFQQKFGSAPSRENWQQQVDFALERMGKTGTGPWYAVRDRGGVGPVTQGGREYAQSLGLLSGAQSPQTTPASVALAPPTAVPATSAYSNAPVYSSDIGTTFRQIGNTVAPGLVDAPTPLTPEQAATQRTADASTAQQYGNVSGGLLGLAQLFAQQELRPRMQEDEMRGEITRGQYRPIQGMRGLL